MEKLKRTATGVWRGSLKDGNGSISSDSGVLEDVPFTFATRFGEERGTNPEELIAAAHAGCFSMALANHLGQKDYRFEEIRTRATVQLEDGAMTQMMLEVEAKVANVDDESFQALVNEAGEECPVSNVLRRGLEISIEATLDK